MVGSRSPHLALRDPVSLLPLFQPLPRLLHWTQGACDMKRSWEKLNGLQCDQREDSECPGLLRHTAK